MRVAHYLCDNCEEKIEVHGKETPNGREGFSIYTTEGGYIDIINRLDIDSPLLQLCWRCLFQLLRCQLRSDAKEKLSIVRWGGGGHLDDPAAMLRAIKRQSDNLKSEKFDFLFQLGIIDSAGTIQRHRFYPYWDSRNDVILDRCVYCDQPKSNREHQ